MSWLPSEECVILRGERHREARINEHSAVRYGFERRWSLEREAHSDKELEYGLTA